MSAAPPVVDAYLDHLRVERRLAAHTLESYGRDLAALAAFAAGSERRVEALDRQAL
jgi:site-specific recombinase XerC